MATKLARKGNPFAGGAVGVVTQTVSAEATDVVTVTLVAKDEGYKGLPAGVTALPAWVSSTANGLTNAALPTTIAATVGGVIQPATGGRVFTVLLSAGLATLTFTQSGAYTGYLCLLLPDGTVAISGVMTFA